MLVEVDDLEKARQLVQSEDLRQATERSGFVDQPICRVLQQSYNFEKLKELMISKIAAREAGFHISAIYL